MNPTSTMVPVAGAQNYLVNEHGQVLNQRPGRGFGLYLMMQVDKVGYCSYKMYRDGNTKGSTVMVHRLVATAFIPNPENKPTVNHIDGNKANNHVSNLEWATMKEQINHAIDTGLIVFKRGADHHRYGVSSGPHSDETKAKMSMAKIGENHPKFKGYYVTPAGRFTSQMAAGVANNMTHSCIANRCKNGYLAGWSFEPAVPANTSCTPIPKFTA